MRLKSYKHFRSGLEKNIKEHLTKKKKIFSYEPKEEKVSYYKPVTYHTYTPDFVLTKLDNTKMYIESKGIWDYEDRLKHAYIRQQHPELDIRFVFTRSKAKIRKGSKTTYADICEGKGRGVLKDMVWKYADKEIPNTWLKECK